MEGLQGGIYGLLGKKNGDCGNSDADGLDILDEY